MNKTNFFGYMASVVSYLEEEQRHGTAHVYRSILRRVIEFEGLDVLLSLIHISEPTRRS